MKQKQSSSTWTAVRASRRTCRSSSRCAGRCGWGCCDEGDQLPTVKDVVARLAINPNTVLKAYRELEHAGLVGARPGVGTFVTGTLSDASLAAHGPLRMDLQRWFAKARRAGLDDESIEALFRDTFRASAEQDVA